MLLHTQLTFCNQLCSCVFLASIFLPFCHYQLLSSTEKIQFTIIVSLAVFFSPPNLWLIRTIITVKVDKRVVFACASHLTMMRSSFEQLPSLLASYSCCLLWHICTETHFWEFFNLTLDSAFVAIFSRDCSWVISGIDTCSVILHKILSKKLCFYIIYHVIKDVFIHTKVIVL